MIDRTSYDDAPIPADEPTCPHCGSTYVSLVTFEESHDEHDIIEVFVCKICGKRFEVPINLPF